MYGKQRQPKESRENAKGTLRYEQETQTWQCTQCGEKYAASDARGVTTHVAAHTRARAKQKRRQEQQIIQDHAYQNADEVRIRTLLQYGHGERGILQRFTENQNKRRLRGKKEQHIKRERRQKERGRSRPRPTDNEQKTAERHPKRKNGTEAAV